MHGQNHIKVHILLIKFNLQEIIGLSALEWQQNGRMLQEKLTEVFNQ